ncbi:MAG: hypothetical protein JST82_13940 [Bacteroidetes bacterium]|nr:hypothetical protein [Bacteroidota bacterium]
MLNKYYLRARLAPTALTAIPLVFLLDTLVMPSMQATLLAKSPYLPMLVKYGLITGLAFILVQLNRLVSKEVFQRLIFKDETHFPSTILMMWKDSSIDTHVKKILHNKVQAEFNIELLDAAHEAANDKTARSRIKSAVAALRNKFRDNKLLLQHNIEYGFFRNLMGGAVIAVGISIVLLIASYQKGDQGIVKMAWTFIGIYLFVITVCIYFIKRYARYYAKFLIEEYISSK